jgi:uncharacterized protein YndB with AHSA1/START domain
MANPLKLLKLKATGFQFIQELPVDAPPARVWKALLDFNGWFGMGDDRSTWQKFSFDARAGGQLVAQSRVSEVSVLFATVTYVEPNKLLRMTGAIGSTHLPTTNVFIWELQPEDEGKRTLLRFCQRSYGYMTADMSEKFQGGWKKLLPQLKKLAEGSGTRRTRGKR